MTDNETLKSLHTTLIDAEKGSPVTWVKLEPIVAPLALIGVTKAAPHPSAARLFVDYFLSEECQKLLAERGFLPAMPSVPPLHPELTPQGGGYKAIYLTQDIVREHRDQWNKIFKDLFQ